MKKEKDICFCENMNWRDISRNYKLSEAFIERYKDKVDWEAISKYQKLSEEFIEKYADRVNWTWISKYQKLSEEFIEKFADRVDWKCISCRQKLSEEFIEKFADRVDCGGIYSFQKLTKKFFEKHMINVNDIDCSESNWHLIYEFRKSSESFIIKMKNHIFFEDLPEKYFTANVINNCYEYMHNIDDDIKEDILKKKNISNEARLYFV